MQNIPLYLKINSKIVVTNPKIYVKDIAKVYCRDSFIAKSVSNMLIKQVNDEENIKIVYSIMYLIDKISKEFPETHIVNLGEEEFVIEYLIEKKSKVPSNIFVVLKVIFLAIVVFLGSGFTIMTFNADVGVAHLFDKLNKLVLGNREGHNVIQITYSIGIGIGIFLFFNHFSRKKAAKDPSPIHVEMRGYESDLNEAIIQDASRNGEIKDI